MAKELVKEAAKLGEYGEASIALDSMAVVTLKAEAKVDIIAELEKMAAATGTKLDDQAIAGIKKLVQSYNAIQG